MSCQLKGEKERFALALLAESCEHDTYLEESRQNQIVLSVSIEPWKRRLLIVLIRNCQRLVERTPSIHWIGGQITTSTCGSYQALERRNLWQSKNTRTTMKPQSKG